MTSVATSLLALPASALVRRALGHSKGEPDFISLKVAKIDDVLRIKALPVATERADTPSQGHAIAERLLRESGAKRARELVEMLLGADPMRGAMLVDADTLERLELDKARGVRATCMDAAGAQGCLPASSKSHYAEAVVLASKVAAAPGIIAEICISDDPDCVIGYVASQAIGYRRITCMKEQRISPPQEGPSLTQSKDASPKYRTSHSGVLSGAQRSALLNP